MLRLFSCPVSGSFPAVLLKGVVAGRAVLVIRGGATVVPAGTAEKRVTSGGGR